ncbi:MAG: hypothetical protein JO013_14015 [Alphaproteobacteria bacterium]|nr:hypothetical protein [Alphaproteobacteria bacterium]
MKGSTNRRLRRLHRSLGLFFAPALLLFSLSGALQTYRWQEPKGYGGNPPGWIVWMASVHKDQALPRAAKAGAPEAGPPPGEKAKAAGPDAKGPAARGPERKGPGRRQGLMLFVGLFGLALFLSTLLGIAIALANAAARRTNLLVLAAGAIVPLLLLFL